jgi:hypothetical protein
VESKETVEIRTPSGELVGPFTPAAAPSRTDEELLAEAGITLEELKQRDDFNGKGYTMAQVLQCLAALEAEINRRQAAGERPLTDDEAEAFVLSVGERL